MGLMPDDRLPPEGFHAEPELIIEFPDDPRLPELPDLGDIHASVETEEPPDTHSIRERWARLADIGAVW